MEKEALQFLLKRYLPQPLSRETLEVLYLSLVDAAEEAPEDWQESIQDLLADDLGLLDALEDGDDSPETRALADAVDRAAEALTHAVYGEDAP